MFLTSFYSCPQGRAVNPSTIGEAILDRADSAEEHYQRLANLFPVVCDKMSAPLVHLMTKTRIAYDSDCGHGETAALRGGITNYTDPFSTNIPGPLLDASQALRLRTAHIFGASTYRPTLDLFTSQRSLFATRGVSISSMPHIDNTPDNAREYAIVSALGNPVSQRACRRYRINPKRFGMFFYDHRQITYDEFGSLAEEFYSREDGLSADSLEKLEAAGGWQLPVNRWCLAPDMLFHSGMYLSADEKAMLPADADIGHIGAINMELRFRTPVFDASGRARGAAPESLDY